MSVNDLMVLRGRVATDVILHPPREQGMQAFARFRMVVPRVRRKDNGEWEEGEPLWYTVRAWGVLAENLNLSLRKGHPILVSGRPTAQAWTGADKETRSEIAVNATSVGHDLVFGVASYSKLKRESSGESEEESAESVEANGVDEENIDTEGRVDADGVIVDSVDALSG